MSQPLRLSVAIPVYNEEEILPELIRRVTDVLRTIPGGPHEIVFVDDGSTDATTGLLEEAARADPSIVCVVLSRNFGHQAAITAALDAATGDAVVVMDADLQDQPEAIPSFLAFHDQGYDVVFARRRDRKEGLLLRSCYFLYYRCLNRLADMRLPLDSGDFALLSRRVVDELRATREHNRYLRGLRSWVGFRQIGVDVERAQRGAGKSKYSFFRLLRLGLDGIFSFSTLPLRVATVLGFAVLAVAALYATYAVYARLAYNTVPTGFTAQLIVTVFLMGMQLVIMGVMGEYLGRIYEETKRRPLYIVGRVIRRSAPHRADADSEARVLTAAHG